MPLLNIHVVKGRTEEEVVLMLQTIHDAMVEAFKVPVGDRYQILTQHDPQHLVLEDTGLGFQRSAARILIQMTTRPRPLEMKKLFYHLVVTSLGKCCGIAAEDVMISCVENSDADWSFGFGRAQFLTGEL